MAEIKDITKFHIFSSAYFASAVNRSQYVTDGKKEIAFIGRSNVGKSSLINSLTGRKKLAYVSREPGKTRTINYYAIQSRRIENEEEQRQDWYLVDLPGYGFAKTSQENKDSWSSFIDEYMKKSPGLIMIGLLLDLRHPGLPIDLKAFDWLKKAGVPIQIMLPRAINSAATTSKRTSCRLKKLFPTASLALRLLLAPRTKDAMPCSK